MNIFLFDFDLNKNAQWFKDNDYRRFNKQIVESTQLFAASMKHWHRVDVIKSDGNPYIVNRILYHPACKYLLEDIDNHYWHINYLESLLKLAPNHACVKSFINALKQIELLTYKKKEPKRYLRITNSDMTGVPERSPVVDYYKRHIENKWKAK